MARPYIAGRNRVWDDATSPAARDGKAARLANSDVPIEAAPLLGQHTNGVLSQELGVSEAELSALREKDVIA